MGLTKKGSALVALILMFGLASAASADTMSATANVEGFGADGGGDASANTPTLVWSEVFSLPAISSLDSVGAQLAHDFGSDITIELIAPGGGTFLIVEGDGPFGGIHHGGGDADELGNSGFIFLLENVVDYTIVPNGTTGINWLDNGNLLVSGTYDQRLVGVESWPVGAFPAGDWTYNLYDSWDTVDAGSVGDIRLSYTVVPEPTSMALMGFGVLAMIRRRK